MPQGFRIRSQIGDRGRTVPQIRALLVELLEATRGDASLDGVAPHLRHAIEAIDDARAVALAVMREAEAERSAGPSWRQRPTTPLC